MNVSAKNRIKKLLISVLLIQIVMLLGAVPATATVESPFRKDLGLSPVFSTDDGTQVLLTGPAHDGLVLADMVTGDKIHVTDGHNAGYYPNISPDGRYVAYKAFKVVHGHRLQAPMLFDVEAREEIQLHDWNDLCGTPRVASDGAIAYTAGDELIVLEPDFSVFAKYDLDGHANILTFSPCGSVIAYNPSPGQLAVIDLQTGGQSILVDGDFDSYDPLFSPGGDRLLVRGVGGQVIYIDLTSAAYDVLGTGGSPTWLDNETVAYVDRIVEEREVVRTDVVTVHIDRMQTQSTNVISEGHAPAVLDGPNVIYRDDKLLHTADLHRFGPRSLQLTPKHTIEVPSIPSEPETIVRTEEKSAAIPRSAVQISGVPFIHQVHDTPTDFNGHYACNAAAALMAIQYYDILEPRTPKGWYVSNIYTYNNITYNTWANDPSYNKAYGGYGYIAQDTGWNDGPSGNRHTSEWMADYISNHGLYSRMDGIWLQGPPYCEETSANAWNTLTTEINNNYPLVVLIQSDLTDGHYITVTGYEPGKYTIVCNDPYGDKNTPGWPSNDGEGARYDWPGKNNGYRNLTSVLRYIYARGEVEDPDPSDKFSAGDWVRTTNALNVRNGYGTSGTTVIKELSTGAVGQVLSHSNNGIYADGFFWWYIHWEEENVTGWSSGHRLEVKDEVSEPPTEAPVHVAPSDGADNVSTTPTFQWEAVPDATEYGLFVSEPPYGSANLVFDSDFDYGAITGTSLTLPITLEEGVTYRWNMRADNDAGEGPYSEATSFTTQTTSHTVSTPSRPSGPTSGSTGSTYSYSTGGSDCSAGHSVQYRFDWDDGTRSSWSSSTTASKSWSSSGTYAVRAQARCSTDTSVTSSWSSSRSVTVTSSASEYVIDPSSRHFPAGSGGGQQQGYVDITTGDDREWEVTSDSQWIEIWNWPHSGTGSVRIDYGVDPNNSTGSREGKITIHGDNGFTGTHTVTQDGVEPEPVLSTSTTEMNIGSGTGSLSFLVQNVGDGTLEWTGEVISGSSWLTVSPTSGSIGASQEQEVTGNYQSNSSTDSRSAVIRFTAPGADGSPVDVTITQAGQEQGIEVPDVVGMSQTEAQTAIMDVDLTVGEETEENHNTVPQGNVISQDPAAGTEVSEGSAVNLVVSLGPAAGDLIGISTIEQLQKIGNDPDYPLDGVYVLTQDIDASETTDWNDGAGFEPIGTWPELAFTGTLDGQGYVITDLTIFRPTEEDVGAFGFVSEGGVIQNVGLEGGAVTGDQYVGGLVGYNEDGTISHSYTTGVVIGYSYIGSLLGANAGGTVSQSYTTGVVTGDRYVGGLIGYHDNNGTVSDSYTTGVVTGDRYVGGLVGVNAATLLQSYTTGAVSGNDDVGGLVGWNDYGTVEFSFWDTETSGMMESDGGTGLPTAEMKMESTFTDAGWDFAAVWAIEESVSYPYLLAFAEPDPVITHTLTYTASANGSVAGDAAQTVVHGASGTAVEAVPDVGYHFVQWSDGITDNPRTDTGVTEDLAVSALFAINEYNLVYVAGPNGSIEGETTQIVEHGFDGAQVTAVSDEGYQFVQWSDGLTENRRRDTNVTKDISVTAEFKEIVDQQYTLNYNGGENGSIVGNASQVVEHGSNGTPVEAIPDDDSYQFIQWSDGVTDNPRTDTNVTEDISVIAIFSSKTGALRVTIEPSKARSDGALWRRVGTDAWRESGATESNVQEGSHTVEFRTISGWIPPDPIPVTIHENQTTTASGSYELAPSQTGSLHVTIEPAEIRSAGAQWRIKKGVWRDSGDFEESIAIGEYEVEFTDIDGWITPNVQIVPIETDQTTELTVNYQAREVKTGGLRVSIEPSEVVGEGAQWRRIGTEAWLDSDHTEWELPVGAYEIELKDIDGWNTPNPQKVSVEEGEIAVVDVAYTEMLEGSGSLRMILIPEDVERDGAQWRRVNTDTWYSSNWSEPNVPEGNYRVEFKAVPGWVVPEVMNMHVPEGKTVTESATYTVPTGGLRVSIEPSDARDAGAQWRRVGTDDWRSSGQTESDVPVGEHDVEFHSISGWHTPSTITVEVPLYDVGTGTGTYTPVSVPDPDPDPDPDPSPGIGCGGAKMADVLSLLTNQQPLYEPALPATRGIDGHRIARVDSPLAVRLRSKETIKPDTVWGVVSSEAGISEEVYAVYASEKDNDVWVVFEPEMPWSEGDVVMFTAGADTVSGASIGPEYYTFVVADTQVDDGIHLVEDAPAFTKGVGPAWRIGPDALFDAPMTIQLPVPEGWDVDDLEVGYHFVSDTDKQLVPAARVEGWLVPDSMRVVSDEHGGWVELTVRHGGVVQLKKQAATNTPAGLSTHIPQGDLFVMLAMAGIIGLLAIRKRRATQS